MINNILRGNSIYKEDFLANTDMDMDMAVVVRLKTLAIDTELLVKEIHQVLKMHHADHDLEIIEQVNPEIDLSF